MTKCEQCNNEREVHDHKGYKLCALCKNHNYFAELELRLKGNKKQIKNKSLLINVLEKEIEILEVDNKDIEKELNK